jgi:hypothetical protein
MASANSPDSEGERDRPKWLWGNIFTCRALTDISSNPRCANTSRVAWVSFAGLDDID